MKVLVVDDSLFVQESFCGLLESVPGVDIVGCAEDVAGALALIASQRPDVVVLDLELRNGDRGSDVLRHLASEHPAVEVVMLSNTNSPAIRASLLAEGAKAYFDKGSEFVGARDWIAARALPRPPQLAGDAQ